MASAIQNLTRQARRRLLLAYIARECGWRCMVILLAVVVSLVFEALWAFPWVAAVGLLVDLAVRWRPPTELGSAIEVDRQFALKELISTGLVACEGDELSAAARAQAEIAAGAIDPRRLEPGSFGLRYWIASLLLAGLVAALPGSPEEMLKPAQFGGGEGRSEDSGERSSEAAMSGGGSRKPQARVAGSAASDFASLGGPEGAGRSAASEAPTRSDAESKGTGGGLSTGGTERPSSMPEQRLSSASGAGGDGSPAAGAGPIAAEVGSASGAGTVGASPRLTSDGQSGGETAEPGQQAAPDMRAVPAPYREVVKAYYAR